jgi:hypothetical protein
MKYAVEMGSGVMIYTSSFIKIGSGIQRLTSSPSIILMRLSGPRSRPTISQKIW